MRGIEQDEDVKRGARMSFSDVFEQPSFVGDVDEILDME
jgi:hypothetical protein